MEHNEYLVEMRGRNAAHSGSATDEYNPVGIDCHIGLTLLGGMMMSCVQDNLQHDHTYSLVLSESYLVLCVGEVGKSAVHLATIFKRRGGHCALKTKAE